MKGAASIPSKVTPTRINPSQVATRLIRLCVSSKLRWLLYSARIGTKAWLKAPSAETRRKRLGILKATIKASLTIPAPNTRAISVSRTNPSMRDINVILPTLASALSKFMCNKKGDSM